MKHKGVEGGTKGGTPLCRTCRRATYIHGSAESQVYFTCGRVTQEPMPFEAYECNMYDDKRHPSKNDLYETAWILRTDPKAKGQWGFISPEERRKKGISQYTDPDWKPSE